MTQHVVIVDDDDLTLKLFAGIASEIHDVVVHPFLSSSEAIDWYHGKQVDCFVFDYRTALNPQLEPTATVQCFGCRAVVTPEAQQSPMYVAGKTCPECHPDSKAAHAA